MNRSALYLLLLVFLLGLSGSALADVGPGVEVKLASPFVAVKAGETYEGSLEIFCLEAGTLSGFTLASDGWTANLSRNPGTITMQAGGRTTLDFTARAQNPDQKLLFTCDFEGYVIRFAMDLSEKNVRNMTEGAPVKQVSDFTAPPGDPSWGETDRILGIAPSLNQDGDRRTITVSGRFGCTTSGGGYLPAHSITVEVWDQDSISGDDLMGSGSTNFDGYYTINVDSSDGDIGSDPDIYVIFILSNSRMRVYEPTSGNTYSYGTSVVNNYSGSNLDLGSLIPSNPDLQPSVFQHTQGTRAWVHDFVLGYDVTAARVEWPSAAWPNCSGDGRIQMRQDFSWSDGTLWHEYGHWYDHEFASWEPFDYCNGICDASATDCGHCFWCQESQSIAWLEGWAQFHGYAVSSWYPGYYGTAPLSGVNAENLATCGGSYDTPLLTEGFIAALCQDIADNNQDSHGVYGSYTDALATGVGTLFAVNDLDNPTGSQDFANKFAARYPGYRENFWETAANCGFWFDTAAPGVVSSLTSTSHTAGVASPDPTASFTWTRAYDNYSGIQGYSYSITFSPGLPSAVMNLADVTSVTTTTLSPGSYYFNIRAVDNAGYWSSNYVYWGPIVIREPDPADLAPFLAAGWSYPLVPRIETDTTTGYGPISAVLPGDATSTYWNLFGQNQGEAATGSGFWSYLNIDGVFTSSAFWGEIQASGLYYGPNRGPVFVQAGRHSFTSRHDATDLVAEVNEINNTFGRQFIWTPAAVPADILAFRSSPPDMTGGWEEVTSGAFYNNCDGLAMPTSGGWWHAMAVWAESNSNDFDARLHYPSTGAENGFGPFEVYSFNGSGSLDAVVVNRNVVSGSTWDVGVSSWYGSGNYKAYHAQSQIWAFGDSVTVAMTEDQPLLLREFYLSVDNIGPVSITASGDPLDGPLRLIFLNRDFDVGSLTAGVQLGSAWTDSEGLARVSATPDAAGWYGIMVYRNPNNGLVARDVTIEISTTPPDLTTWIPPGWYAAITPRPALDGTPTYCPEPTILLSDPDPTYINVGATNLGPVPSTLPSRVFRDDVYMGYINWPEIGSGATVRYNWEHQFFWSSGRHVLSYRVDPLNSIEETNEYNNIRGEQWIWTPVPLTPPMATLRAVPPPNTAGWDDITTGEPLWFNCDGLRLMGTGTGFWKVMAIRPEDGSDFDLRLHEPSAGAKNGFGASLAGSFEAGTVTEYMLVDQNSVAAQNYDVGVLKWSGDGFYRAQAANAPYYGNQPVDDWGPFEIPAGGLVTMVELLFPPGSYGITLENLSGADLAMAIHQEGVAYQTRLDAASGADENGPGQNEMAGMDVSDYSYHCLVVYRSDQSSAEAPFRLNITNELSPVGDNLVPQVTRIAGAYPNPFNPQTTVAFDMSQNGHVAVSIYDVQGRLVRRLVDETMLVGSHTAVWQGRDDAGRSVASGVYFVQMETALGQDMTKLVLVK